MFLIPQVTEKQKWVTIDGNYGTDCVPLDIIADSSDSIYRKITVEEIKDYTENDEIYEIDIVEGYGTRLSAPGYLDCTPWSVFDTVKECLEHLEEMHCHCHSEELCDICEFIKGELV